MRVGGLEFRPSWLPSLATASLLALLVSLGIWQLQRGEFKQALEADHAERAEDAPLLIDGSHGSAEGLRYRAVVAEGRLDAGRQFLLDNRTHNGVAGYHVLTPLRLSGQELGVIVNRGWVPVGDSRSILPELPAASGPVRVRGTLWAPRGEAFLLGPSGYENDAWPRVVQHIDFAAMQRALGYELLPYAVLLEEDQPGGFVREWRPYYGIGPDTHRAYAFQWFALAVALAIIYISVNTHRRGGRPQSPPEA